MLLAMYTYVCDTKNLAHEITQPNLNKVRKYIAKNITRAELKVMLSVKWNYLSKYWESLTCEGKDIYFFSCIREYLKNIQSHL